MRTRSSWCTVVVLGVMALVAAGCGGSSTKTVTAGSPAPASTSGGQATTAKGASANADAASAPALAARDGGISGDRVHLEIAEFKRSGSTVALTLRLTTTGTSTLGTMVGQTFDDGVAQVVGNPSGIQRGSEASRNANSMDGVALIDTKNRRKHLVGRDALGNCLCDVNLGFIESGAPLLLSATFAAPPPDVKAMDVFIPHFSTFKDVALQG